jgi:DNA-binding FrmR family transcriptional regulator
MNAGGVAAGYATLGGYRIGACPTSMEKVQHVSHLSREKLDLVNRTKKIRGQIDSVERALDEDAPCADVLQRLAAARGAINGLMAELLEDHVRHHMPRKTKTSAGAVDDIIEVIRSYLK